MLPAELVCQAHRGVDGRSLDEVALEVVQLLRRIVGPLLGRHREHDGLEHRQPREGASGELIAHDHGPRLGRGRRDEVHLQVIVLVQDRRLLARTGDLLHRVAEEEWVLNEDVLEEGHTIASHIELVLELNEVVGRRPLDDPVTLEVVEVEIGLRHGAGVGE